MNDRLTIATIQFRWKHFNSLDQLRDEMRRYLRLAKSRGATLMVLPELSGLVVGTTLDDTARRGSVSFWQRLRGAAQRGPAAMRETLPQLISDETTFLRRAYVDLFATAAREHATWIVAGSLYMRDGDGPVRALSGLFDPNGNLVGWQAKLHLDDGDRPLAVAGESLNLFETPWGRLGILLGGDILYPELGRALAYRGAELIVNPVAATSVGMWKRLRIAALARAQENQLLVAQSFLLGENEVTADSGDRFVGRSAILAPVEMTQRLDGILVEMAAEAAEGTVAAECDLVRLRELWRSADERPREMLRGPLYARLLTSDYESGATINERADQAMTKSARSATPPALVLERPGWPDEPRPVPPVRDAAADDAASGSAASVPIPSGMVAAAAGAAASDLPPASLDRSPGDADAFLDEVEEEVAALVDMDRAREVTEVDDDEARPEGETS